MATFGLMDFKKVLSGSVNGKAAIAGAAVGTVGIGAVNFGLNAIKMDGVPLSAKIPAGLAKIMPLISAALAGAIGYFALKKAQPKYAGSFAIGSLSAGTVLTVANFLKDTKLTTMNEYVQFRLPGMGYVVPASSGQTVSAPGRMAGLANLGLLVPDTRNPRLNGLAEMARSGMDEYVEYDVP